jgi:sugar phosphate isomerase/epimerase
MTEMQPGKIKPVQDNILFVTMPYKEVLRNASFLEDNSVGVEIAAHDTNWLLNIFKESVTGKLAKELRKKNITVRTAGPIFDLNPGSLDHVVRKHTESCFLRAVDLARSLESDSLVLPSGFNPLLPEESVDGWRELSLETWERVGEAAGRRKIEVLIKNIFDHTPEIISGLLRALDGFPFGTCLDVGHINAYSNIEIGTWLKLLNEHIGEVHLHDNLGTSDDHIALGEGIVDYRSVFKKLVKRDPLPPLTFDMEKGEAVKSLSYIARLDLFGLQLSLL